MACQAGAYLASQSGGRADPKVSKMEQDRVIAGYLLRRDEYRAVLRAERIAAGESGDTKLPRWVGTTVQLAGRMTK